MLAKIGAEQEAEFILLSSPPVDLFKVLEDDCNGVFSNRLCNDSIVWVLMLSSGLPKKKRIIQVGLN